MVHKQSQKKKRIAIVHDAFCVPGGAERVVFWMAKAFPEAPIFTSVYLKDKTFPEYRYFDIRVLPFSNYIQNERQFKLLFPLWLMKIRDLDFSDYDVVLTSSTYLAKYIRTTGGASHKAYIHAPFRFLWKPESYSSESIPTPKLFTVIIKAMIPHFRLWDKKITRLIPEIATNSQNIAKEIFQIYQKSSVVINPPVQIDDYPLASEVGEYFLTVSRLISHKRIDLPIEACNRLQKKLLIVGEGPERNRLEQISGDSIKFLGRVSESELKNLYLHSQALLFPSHEDYGIVPLESQACGRPVIAYGQGGVLETIKEGETGVFFLQQNVESIMTSILDFEKMNLDPKYIRRWVRQFDVNNFTSKLQTFVGED